MGRRWSVIPLALTLAHAFSAVGDEPKFAYGKREDESKAPEWAASITSGFGAATGNAQNLNLSGGANAAHRFGEFGENLLSFDANAAIARSTLPVAVPSATPGLAELTSISQTTSELWSARLRYDRFFGANATYGFVSTGGDVPAGKEFLAGGQVGYARALYKTGTDELALEVGIDYTYQRFVAGNPDSVNIVSLRSFLGYSGKPQKDLSYSISLEWLGNLNSEARPTGVVGSFGDDRVTGKVEVTWKALGNGHLGVRFRALYDSAPAPRPLPTLPAGLQWPANYQPLANPLDTVSEIVLLYKLL